MGLVMVMAVTHWRTLMAHTHIHTHTHTHTLDETDMFMNPIGLHAKRLNYTCSPSTYDSFKPCSSSSSAKGPSGLLKHHMPIVRVMVMVMVMVIMIMIEMVIVMVMEIEIVMGMEMEMGMGMGMEMGKCLCLPAKWTCCL